MASISNEQMVYAVVQSGYILEDRVTQLLRKHSWYAEPNSRYKDLSSGKEREIDVFALKRIPPGKSQFDNIESTLIIECMNNQEPVVFFNNHEDFISRIAALNFSVLNEHFRRVLSLSQQEINSPLKFKHSSQYCSFTKIKDQKAPNDGWIASHSNDQHDALFSLFQCIKHHQDQFKNFRNTDSFLTGFFYRPVVILQGDLYLVSQSESITLDAESHIKYVVPKSDNNGRLFIIDVIKEAYLPEYLRQIEDEDLIISDVFYQNRDSFIENYPS